MLRGIRSSALWLIASLSLVSISVWAGGEDKVPLRSKGARCGFYLVNRHETSRGVLLSQGLSVSAFETALRAKINEVGLDAAFPQTHRIEVVGAPRDRDNRESLEQDIRKSLLRMGIEPEAEIVTVRETLQWIEDARGVYVESRSGKWRKIADSTPAAIQEAIAKGDLPTEADYLVIGTPVVGLRETLEEAGLDPNQINHKSAFRAGVEKAMAHPIQFLKYFGELSRSMLPYKEDYQSPTSEETRTALRKAATPGMVNMGALLYQGKPLLSILLPTVFVNGLNSFYVGKYSSAVRRWMTRSDFWGRTVKSMLMTSIFAGDIYFLGDTSHTAQLLSWAGVYGFFTTKWASIVFQTLWRLPVGAWVDNWTNWRINSGNNSEDARNTAANIAKLNSYLMTPAFIHSLLMRPDEAWFMLTNGPNGLGISTEALPDGVQSIFAFGPGHAGMLVAGAIGSLGLLKLSALNPWGKVADWVDRGESAVFSCVGGVCRSGWNLITGNRKPD